MGRVGRTISWVVLAGVLPLFTLLLMTGSLLTPAVGPYGSLTDYIGTPLMFAAIFGPLPALAVGLLVPIGEGPPRMGPPSWQAAIALLAACVLGVAWCAAYLIAALARARPALMAGVTPVWINAVAFQWAGDVSLGVMIAGCIAGAWVWLWLSRRPLAGRCHRCGYDLAGNTSGVCPECGTPAGGPPPAARREAAR